MNALVQSLKRQAVASTCAIVTCLWLTGCSYAPTAPAKGLQVQMPLEQGWFEGKTVFYITTDVSDAGVAKDKRANFAPRLVHALLPEAADKAARPRPSSVDKVYAFTNFSQGSVFASAPKPMGYQNTESAYTPLWLMMTVTWKTGATPRALTSEEAVLDATEKGLVVLASTGVIVNCPIVHRGAEGALPEVTITR